MLPYLDQVLAGPISCYITLAQRCYIKKKEYVCIIGTMPEQVLKDNCFESKWIIFAICLLMLHSGPCLTVDTVVSLTEEKLF